MRYAAIDIGSNAIRLLIADILPKGETSTFKKNTLLRIPLRLGDDAFMNQRISEEKSEQLIKTLFSFALLMDVYQVDDYMACATSAMREAKNGQELVKKIFKTCNIKINIVEGQEEANIIYSSHIEQLLDLDKNYLYIDVGGGSTEMSVFSSGVLIASKSFNIGTIRILDNTVSASTWEEAKAWVKKMGLAYKNLIGIGTGGNINKIYRLANLKEYELLSTKKLTELQTSLSAISLEERINKLGLKPDRADVIIPACEIYANVFKWARIKKTVVPSVGMVDGIIQLLIEKNLKA
ncbi:MAG: exopolyphosphatase [Sphingobacteriaceae bacterium]|nr:exopolyphosphatase [Sphingobacteriaceae bacterium]